MARLIDTSAIITLERRRLPLSALAANLQGEPIAIASITASELLVGYYRVGTERQRQERQAFIEFILTEFPVLAFDLDVARTHARIASELEGSGRSIGTHDLLIAATALTWGLVVVTHNLRHFDRVPGLQVSVPTW